MKNRKELLVAVGIWLTVAALTFLSSYLGELTSDTEALSNMFHKISIVLFFVALAMSILAALYSVWMMYRANTARKEKRIDDCIASMVKIRYTMPLGLPLVFIGFRWWIVLLAVVMVYGVYKWGLKLYPWNSIKQSLTHKNGTTWETTILVWINLIFFIGACIIPLACFAIMTALLYLFGSTGIVDRMIKDVNGVNSGGKSGAPHTTCANCAYFTGYSCSKTDLGASSNDPSCPNFSY